MTDDKKLSRRRFLTTLAGAAGMGAVWELGTHKGKKAGPPGSVPDRLPPGQHWVGELIEYSAGGWPAIDEKEWKLSVGGLVAYPHEFTLREFRALPHVDSTSDFHCVTAWSVKDCRWRGVRLADLLAMAVPRIEAAHIYAECLGGYSTNFPRSVGNHPDVLLADGLNGKPLEHRLGGPLRLVVPALYAYKSAKWVNRILLLREDKPGFWERSGYSNKADPWKEQRWSRDD
jgi:DMSO/TMAO reductase YedYZ molybdopterin-dependent catalytic subunit